MFVGELLRDEVPALAADGSGSLEIVAIARRPGVLSKVAIRGAGFIGADHLARVSQQLDGERIQVVTWRRHARAYIADALGLGEVPPMLLLPAIGHARVLLGEIDVRGIAGWRGLRLEVLGLYAVLSGAQRAALEGQELQVRVTRMDSDEGRIFVSDRLVADGQLPLI